jgi:hypothetical protein
MGVSTVVQAEVLAGGPLYGGPASVGGTVTCRVFNAGGGSLSLDTREIVTNTGVAITLSSDTCAVGIPPGQSCASAGQITGNFAFSCHMFDASTDGIITGVIDIESPSGAILATSPLRKF